MARMSKQSEIRRLAMQVLYQIDMRGEPDRQAIDASLVDAPGSAQDHTLALALAWAAWNQRADADALALELAPDWPTHRQPPVDRAILRLAYHEMASGRTPVKVAINEAVELAKAFCAENGPPFINGVLDKMARKLRETGKLPEVVASTPPASPDAWLADALDSKDH